MYNTTNKATKTIMTEEEQIQYVLEMVVGDYFTVLLEDCEDAPDLMTLKNFALGLKAIGRKLDIDVTKYDVDGTFLGAGLTKD